LSGQLVDKENNPIEGATVVLSGKDMIGARGAVTNLSGNFKIWKLKESGDGFEWHYE